MLPSEIEFASSVSAIRSYLRFLATVDVALGAGARSATGELAETSPEFLLATLARDAALTTPKRFAHTLIVVELYGAIEQLVEGLLRDYLARVQLIHPSLADLPGRLLRTHARKSAELLLAADRLPFQVAPRDVIANLHSCQHGAGPYKLNTDAFTMRTANMRTSQIRQLFGDVGVENVTRRAYDGPHFQLYLRRSGGRRQRHRQETEFPELDDLVTYRNEAAHGRPSNVLSRNLLGDFISFAEALGTALGRAVEEASVQAAVARNPPLLGALKGVFRSRIVCLELATRVRIGEQIVGRAPDGRCRFSDVSRIELDHKAIDAAQAGQVVGLEVTFPAKANQEFYKLPW